MAPGLNKQSTAEDVLDGVSLAGRRFLVTGVSSGAGAEIARTLVRHGASVTGTARDVHKEALQLGQVGSSATFPGGRLELVELDLASLESIRTAADVLVAEQAAFDGIIANAGVMATPFQRTEDGFEMQFGTNHLGHFVLINRIAPLIEDDGRVVVVSSNGHRGADVDLEDANFDHTGYDRWQAYNRSKTANSLFAIAFDKRHRGRRIRACAVMPGTGMTPITRHLSAQEIKDVFGLIAADRSKAGIEALELKSPEQLAATSVWAVAVADPAEIGGKYLEDCHVAEVDDVPGIRDGVMSYAIDPARAEMLWKKSEELVGEYFDRTRPSVSS